MRRTPDKRKAGKALRKTEQPWLTRRETVLNLTEIKENEIVQFWELS